MAALSQPVKGDVMLMALAITTLGCLNEGKYNFN